MRSRNDSRVRAEVLHRRGRAFALTAFAALAILCAGETRAQSQARPSAPAAPAGARQSKFQPSAPLKARIWLIPENTMPDDPAAHPRSRSATIVGRDATNLFVAPDKPGAAPAKIPLPRIAALDFEIEYDRFAVSRATATGDWNLAVNLLRKAYSPFLPFLDAPGNNAIDGAYDLGAAMFSGARATMRAAATGEDREQALRRFSAAHDVFASCAKATWSDFGALAALRAIRCQLASDPAGARRAERELNAIREPLPGDPTYGHYWLLRAELARLAGNSDAALEAAVKSLAHENKDVETFPDALLVSAQCYDATGNPYRARDVYFEVAKLFPSTDWAADAMSLLRALMASGRLDKPEDSSAESSFFGLEEDMNALANELLSASGAGNGLVFDEADTLQE